MDTLTSTSLPPLLDSNEPSPVQVSNPDGASPYLLVCEHAGNAIPAALDALGLPDDERVRHIAWDIGAAAVAQGISDALDAPLFLQPYSRLVIDCNRPWDAQTLVPAVSDGTEVPGNHGLDDAQRRQRWDVVHQPFHGAIAATLDHQPRRALVTVHSFTPVLRSHPEPRALHLGLLYDLRDSRLADAMFDALVAAEPDLRVERNQPYAVEGLSDYAIPVHGLQRGIPNVLIEIRHDLIATPAGQAEWSQRLARALATLPIDTLLQDAR